MSKKLLLADDSITIQKVIQITFAHEDYELTITDNGDAALAKAQEIKPDLVMTDIYMPGKNGYELTTAIKQDPALRHIPVLLLAGSFEPFDEEKARRCMADAWIEKPFESQNLIDKVAELLSAVQPALEASMPFAEPDHSVATAPEAIAADVVAEIPLDALDESEAAATQDDPFGDISFEDETFDAEPAPSAIADDWSDLAVESAAEASVDEDIFDVTEDFDFAEEKSTAEAVEDFGFAEEMTAAEVIEDFGFAEVEPVAATAFAPVEEVPLAEIAFDSFEMDDDEILPLGDDDILDTEDLEPVMPEQTLAAWSRDEVAAEDSFDEPLVEDVFESEPAYVAPFAPVHEEETAVFFDDEPVAEIAPVSEEPVEDFTFTELPAADVSEPEPAAVTTATMDIEAKASTLSEEDIERIIEKVVTRVVEKLAGVILERVAWEVVPDLAENLIREEIRKIKDTAA